MARQRMGQAFPEVVLPITPMLDMTFQLLTFFIITYHPASTIEGKMEFSLPATGEPRNPAPEVITAETVPDIRTEVKSQLTIRLRTQHDGLNEGLLSAVIVQPTGGTEMLLPNLDSLAKYLKERRGSGDLSPANDIQIQAENRLKYAWVMAAMDTCVKSGFQRIGFAPPSDSN